MMVHASPVRKLKATSVELFERPVHMRLPFRFGKAVVTSAPQLFARLTLTDEAGTQATGFSAELLVPKWFDKNPALTHEDNFEELRNSVRLAAARYLGADPASAFDLYLSSYSPHRAEAQARSMALLTAGFGQALLDRAMVDALCRLENLSFYQVVNNNRFGLHSHHPALQDLAGFDLDAFLAGLRPSDDIAIRHTVGFRDPLTADEAATGPDDGLPVALDDCIATYGYRYFKILLTGELEDDVARLGAVAAILDTHCGDYIASLDGSEQFGSAQQLVTFLQALRDTKATAKLYTRLNYLEQPLNRDSAAGVDLSSVSALLPVVLDEGDNGLDAFPQARELGYRGVSSKSCKGLYKSLLNTARCHLPGAGSAFMTGEDLTMQPGIAMQQDMALASIIGLDNVQRNGQYYVGGFSGADDGEQANFVTAFPGFYERQNKMTILRIKSGATNIASLKQPGFASAATPDFNRTTALALAPDMTLSNNRVQAG